MDDKSIFFGKVCICLADYKPYGGTFRRTVFNVGQQWEYRVTRTPRMGGGGGESGVCFVEWRGAVGLGVGVLGIRGQ